LIRFCLLLGCPQPPDGPPAASGRGRELKLFGLEQYVGRIGRGRVQIIAREGQHAGLPDVARLAEEEYSAIVDQILAEAARPKCCSSAPAGELIALLCYFSTEKWRCPCTGRI
jgi:hypothetical protein